MTKDELIHFLEPFSGEIQIVFRSIIGLTDFKAKYEIRSNPYRTRNGNLLERGEGIVILAEYE